MLEQTNKINVHPESLKSKSLFVTFLSLSLLFFFAQIEMHLTSTQ